LSEATTRWLKEHLGDAVARHEQIAAEIEGLQPGADAVSPEGETGAPSSETPGQ
jgi:hypothetical protein